MAVRSVALLLIGGLVVVYPVVVQSSLASGRGHGVVDDRGYSFGTGAVRAAVEVTACFDAVADDAALAVLADRCHPVDSALKRVEGVHRSLGVDLKRHRIIVAAYLTTSHRLRLLGRVVAVIPGTPASRSRNS
jgi:hypothetical protein